MVIWEVMIMTNKVLIISKGETFMVVTMKKALKRHTMQK